MRLRKKFDVKNFIFYVSIFRYIDEAVVALDTDDPVTKEHVSGILEGLCEQIKHTIQLLAQNDPTNALQRPLKRLLMAAKSLMK